MDSAKRRKWYDERNAGKTVEDNVKAKEEGGEGEEEEEEEEGGKKAERLRRERESRCDEAGWQQRRMRRWERSIGEERTEVEEGEPQQRATAAQ